MISWPLIILNIIYVKGIIHINNQRMIYADSTGKSGWVAWFGGYAECLSHMSLLLRLLAGVITLNMITSPLIILYIIYFT